MVTILFPVPKTKKPTAAARTVLAKMKQDGCHVYVLEPGWLAVRNEESKLTEKRLENIENMAPKLMALVVEE
jgi:hypothetical protein